MKAYAEAPRSNDDIQLDIFCSKISDAYRVYVMPTWMPEDLRACFDEHGEICPVYLDFEDLDYHMRRRGVEYFKRPTTLGGMQLLARGPAAAILTQWLLSACASNVR